MTDAKDARTLSMPQFKFVIERLVLVASWRYRCDACALKEPAHV